VDGIDLKRGADLWSLKNKRNQTDVARVVYSRNFSLKTRE